MVSAQLPRYTASESVLLAADDLTAAGKEEFSEWDLTVAAWSVDRARFGLRGYAQSYPDHKRVMMEIMGNKASSPIIQKYMTKVRPNTYRLTTHGRAAVARLRNRGKEQPLVEIADEEASKPLSVKELYDKILIYANRAEFRRWQENPEEPRDWNGGASFLGLTGKDATVPPANRLEEIREAVRTAIDWCRVQELAFLTRGSGQGGAPIHFRDLADLLDFLQVLSYRFPDLLEKKSVKPKKRFSDG
jgi:hypothetical protein